MRTTDRVQPSLRSALRFAVTSAAVLLLAVGCATRPRQSVNADPTAADVQQPGSAPGTAAQPAAQTEGIVQGGDVDFEEDQLPSAPEDVAASPIGVGGGEPVDVEELPDELPADRAAESPQGALVPPSVVTPVPPSVQTPVPGSRARMLLGFRVQIHAGENLAEAEQLAQQAQTRLQVPAYTTFESPFYKVRLGDFLDRADALVLRERVRGYGYPGAWVVTTPVLADAAAAAAAATRAP